MMLQPWPWIPHRGIARAHRLEQRERRQLPNDHRLHHHVLVLPRRRRLPMTCAVQQRQQRLQETRLQQRQRLQQLQETRLQQRQRLQQMSSRII